MVSIVETKSKEIVARFKNAGVSIDEPEVSRRLKLLIEDFKVQELEAVRTVTGFFRQKHGLKFEQLGSAQGPAGIRNIGDLKADNEWVSVHAKVVQIWEPRTDIIHQTGLVGDESGVVKFTIFAKNSSLGTLEEGKSYALNNFVTSLWQGQLSIKGNKNSSIGEIQEDIKVGRQTETVVGIITHLTNGSGLIKRCPECNRKLLKGACGEHGKVEGIYDLRIKAVLEPFGKSEAIDLLMNRNVTAALTGIDLDTAKEMATESLDMACVQEVLEKKVSGRYYQITGNLLPSNNMLVESIKPISLFSVEKAKAVIAALEGGV